MNEKSTAILYHGGCPDGFGGAFAAWKKFGDTADYIPVKHGRPVPEHLDGKDLFLIDFCFPQDKMDELKSVAKSVTVLDHHEGVRAVATQFPGVFDPRHSGATIAWNFFHPTVAAPRLLEYVEDGDLYRFALQDARQVLAYVYTLTESFSDIDEKNTNQWNVLANELDDPAQYERIVQTGTLFLQYHEHVVVHGIHRADTVVFEGYECFLTGSTGEFASDIGNRLARLKPPLALVLSADADGIRVSLRSDGSVNVAELAQKYGGNGHPAAAGFGIAHGQPVPWTKK
jgi:uncharacterized protein